MGLFGSSKPAEPETASQQVAKQIREQITQELAVVNATELVTKITENCFDKCVIKPESVLTPEQDRCLNQCSERYMRSWNIVSKYYVSRIQHENH